MVIPPMALALALVSYKHSLVLFDGRVFRTTNTLTDGDAIPEGGRPLIHSTSSVGFDLKQLGKAVPEVVGKLFSALHGRKMTTVIVFWNLVNDVPKMSRKSPQKQYL